jgi:ABC-2 type transport system ATP-binding protein
MQAIDIKDLSKIYRSKRQVVKALQKVTFSVTEGEVFGFLGPNGAGKSTTIKCLLGLIRPTAGSATIMGEDAGSQNARTKIGYLPENPSFYDYLTAEEYLIFTGRIFKVPEKVLSERCDEILTMLDLWDARKRPMRGYSKGMVQRLGIAQVLIHDPDVYILDEPMSGLDPLGRALVKKIINDLRQRGKSVFFSTHITADVESICDRVGVIVKGEMKCIRKVDEISVDGITGYEVRYINEGADCPDTVSVNADQLAVKLAELHANGSHLLLVEPLRKNLEEFFMDVVRQNEV